MPISAIDVATDGRKLVYAIEAHKGNDRRVLDNLIKLIVFALKVVGHLHPNITCSRHIGEEDEEDLDDEGSVL